ncbi:5-(carboxyamino)imidazole ribonucleotide synthase [Frateuria aurantia]
MSRRDLVLGVLGGGQLARMLAQAASPLGIRTVALDPAEGGCAADVAMTRQAAWDDWEALQAFAEQVDAVTFDFENVPAATARWLAERVPVYPPPAALEVAQDRLSEKTLFRACGLPTPEFRAIGSKDDLIAAVNGIGLPAILKTRRLGYDGKGQFRLRETADLEAAWDALGAQADTVGLILEAFVPFERELSVIAVRDRQGGFRCWPLTRNWHVDGVLSLSLAPAPQVDTALMAEAMGHARTLAERLQYVGVFALELFVRDGQLLGNEMAPRVHNSGHWTIEGAVTSQFENHVRAVLGLPLGLTTARGQAAMFNWIGEMPDRGAALAVPDLHWHDYGKSARAGRKVGHATICAAEPAVLAARLEQAAQWLQREAQAEPAVSLLREA